MSRPLWEIRGTGKHGPWAMRVRAGTHDEALARVPAKIAAEVWACVLVAGLLLAGCAAPQPDPYPTTGTDAEWAPDAGELEQAPAPTTPAHCMCVRG